MADYSKFYDARKVVSRILEQDFIGPVTKDECLAELPVQYYIMGKAKQSDYHIKFSMQF